MVILYNKRHFQPSVFRLNWLLLRPPIPAALGFWQYIWGPGCSDMLSALLSTVQLSLGHLLRSYSRHCHTKVHDFFFLNLSVSISLWLPCSSHSPLLLWYLFCELQEWRRMEVFLLRQRVFLHAIKNPWLKGNSKLDCVWMCVYVWEKRRRQKIAN